MDERGEAESLLGIGIFDKKPTANLVFLCRSQQGRYAPILWEHKINPGLYRPRRTGAKGAEEMTDRTLIELDHRNIPNWLDDRAVLAWARAIILAVINQEDCPEWGIRVKENL